jgi:hypothetical protein
LSDTDRAEDAQKRLLSLYSAAVQMAVYESQYFWTIVSAFLLADSLLASFLLGQAATAAQPLERVSGAAVGVIASFLWIAAIVRSAGYSDLRMAQARELERKLQDGSLFVKGRDFAQNKSVIVDGVVHEQRGLARVVRIKDTALLLAVSFAVFFVIVLYYSLVKQFGRENTLEGMMIGLILFVVAGMFIRSGHQ